MISLFLLIAVFTLTCTIVCPGAWQRSVALFKNFGFGLSLSVFGSLVLWSTLLNGSRFVWSPSYYMHISIVASQ
jgi:hypothetical protein